MENYADRKSSAFLGLYGQAVDEQPYPYIRPAGDRHEERPALVAAESSGRLGAADNVDAPFFASALHYSPESLSLRRREGQFPLPEIEPDACVWLCIDNVQMGLGCVNSWGALPREEYRIPYADRTFRFRLTPARLLR